MHQKTDAPATGKWALYFFVWTLAAHTVRDVVVTDLIIGGTAD